MAKNSPSTETKVIVKKPFPFMRLAGGFLIAVAGWELLKKTGVVTEKVGLFADVTPSDRTKWTLKSGKTYNLSIPAIATGLDRCYRGVNVFPDPCNQLLYIIYELMNKNELHLLHNAWVNNIDNEESIYEFLSWQVPYPASLEHALMQGVLSKMSQNGLAKK